MSRSRQVNGSHPGFSTRICYSHRLGIDAVVTDLHARGEKP